MSRIRVGDGTHLEVKVDGDGPPVVLLAGFGLDHRLWTDLVPVLTAAGHQVVRVDQRGHGASDKTSGGYDVPHLAEDLLDVLDALDLRDVTLVGHSFGGQVAFRAVAHGRGRVGRLVLVGSNGVSASRTADFPFGVPVGDILPALVAAERRDVRGSRRANIARAFAKAPAVELVDQLLRQSLQMPTTAALACYRSMLEDTQVVDLERVRIPVLQVIGGADPVHSARGAAWLASRLSDSRLAQIDGCGHYPMLESPDQLETSLMTFLPTVSGTASGALDSR